MTDKRATTKSDSAVAKLAKAAVVNYSLTAIVIAAGLALVGGVTLAIRSFA